MDYYLGLRHADGEQSYIVGIFKTREGLAKKIEEINASEGAELAPDGEGTYTTHDGMDYVQIIGIQLPE